MREFELVVPSYNEARSLPLMVERVRDAAIANGFTPARFQLVLVQNGSTDDSDAVLGQLLASDLSAWFRVVRVELNQGYGFGIMSGLKTVRAAFVGWSHSDLQCDPRDAFKALALAQASKDRKVLVKGVREGRSGKEVLVSRVFEAIARVLLGLKVREMNAQPKIFPAALLREIQDPPTTFAFDLYVIYRAVKAGYRLETFTVLFPARLHGASKWAAKTLSRYKTIFGIVHYIWNLSRREGRV